MIKILVIDDEEDNLTLLSALLIDLIPDAVVLTALSGPEGLEKARSEVPDTIILDIRMPGMDGYEVCQKLKRDTKTKHIPVIILTAIYVDSKIRIRCLELGADAFLTKPVNGSELVAQVNVMLRVKTAEDLLRQEKRALEELVKEKLSALQTSEDRYKKLFDHASIGILTADIEARKIVDCNPAICQLLGYSEDEFRRLGPFDIHPPESLDYVVSEFKALARGEKQILYDIPCLCKDGTKIFVNITGNRIVINGRNYNVGYYTDITERKLAQEKFRKVCEAAHDAIVMLNDKGNVTLWNPAAERIFGYSEQEVMENDLHKLIAPARFHQAIEKGFQRYLKEGKGPLIGKTLEVQALRKDGTEFPVELTVSAIQISGKRAAIGTIRDITVQKQSEAEQKRLVTAIEQSTESIVITDSEGTILYVNPAFEKITGFTKEEAKGQNPRMLKSGEQDEQFYQTMWKILAKGDVWKNLIFNKKKNGTLYEEEMTISPIRDEMGEIINYVAVKRDVSRERMLEKKLRQSQKMEAIGTLAGGIAHDFNNILFAILGYATMAKEYIPENVRYQKDVEQIIKAGNRAKDLVQQILTFSRRGDQETEPLQIAPLIKETIKFLRASLPATIEIRQNISQGCGDIMADHTQIHQILMNLCTNAGYAMRGKGGILEVNLKKTEINNDLALLHRVKRGIYLQLTIKDTGVGIPPEVQERIFEPFYTTKPEGEGTGMGLSVVHGILQSYQGVITFETEQGKGTSFDLFFPMIEIKQKIESIEEFANLTGHEHILVVDDEVILADLLRKMLQTLGYKVTIASNSQLALETFETDPHQFDLVITDQTMPGLSGDQLARQLLRIRSDLPIILISGFSHNIDKDQIKKMGVKALLSKPFDLNQIAKILRKTLDQSEGVYE